MWIENTMPLLDHFHPPLSERYHWESFLSNWATRLADVITTVLPQEYLAEEQAEYPNSYEIKVFSTRDDLTMVANIELISPGNKDRLDERHAFAAKCASYLYQGVSLVMIDIVTSRKANLHNETLRLIEVNPQYELPANTNLYAVAYRPVARQGRSEIDVWQVTFAVGDPLPTLPLRLTGDLFVPVDFETAYEEACRRRRIS
jgi:hypothetical protein